MLDQNTDRMWYVIGAVIVGAAIILIINGTAPELFASVGETFKGKTEETTEVVDGIGIGSHSNVLENAHWEHGILAKGTMYEGSGITNGIHYAASEHNQYIARHIPVYGATGMTLELHEALPMREGHYGRINAYDNNKQVISTFVDYITNTDAFVEDYPLPVGTAYIRVMLIDGDSGAYSIHLTHD